jgi:hypothetical protein
MPYWLIVGAYYSHSTTQFGAKIGPLPVTKTIPQQPIQGQYPEPEVLRPQKALHLYYIYSLDISAGHWGWWCTCLQRVAMELGGIEPFYHNITKPRIPQVGEEGCWARSQFRERERNWMTDQNEILEKNAVGSFWAHFSSSIPRSGDMLGILLIWWLTIPHYSFLMRIYPMIDCAGFFIYCSLVSYILYLLLVSAC